MKEIKKYRIACVGAFEKARNVIEKRKDINTVFETEKSRETFLNNLITTVEEYSSKIISTVASKKDFGTCFYYTWSSSIFDPQNIGYDDYRYDLMGFYFNVAAAHYGVAQYILCTRATVGTISSFEKEAYHTLLKASGYFGLCEELSKVIKESPIGVAKVPFPMDSAQNSFELLGDICVSQAQEIGVFRAFDADTKCASDTVVRLAHRLVDLYENAKATASKISSRNPAFISLTTVLTFKKDLYEAHLYNFAATWAFQKSPANGMYFLGEAKKRVELLEEYNKLLGKGKLKLPQGGAESLQNTIAEIKRNDERLSKVNSMVHRASPTSTPLPASQILAVKANSKLPSELPK
ncbi:hypothetical protein AGDE_10021 [Angomonas deanei]|uniref:BRO1-like domain containing protein, putative n=1 Tax=Angomonas deanei TaxID=59799 RepID=A0A7G2CEW5_9TRYP|nr:hypothetical protein AGDE_10021 [Angomonas deanei]CAD2217414.1 BRO1-like domain containing protein, putative [Angomonas deanei]|eukprot:EPY29307.1 hypothetical protein AGDE_10021 [Angomonas deanei]